MKYLTIALGTAIAVSLLAVAARPALAAEARWEQCKKVVTAKTGNWKDALCSKGEKEGEWLTMEVTETEEVTSHTIGKVELTDTKALGGVETIACEWVDRGWIGINGGGGESEIRATNCARVSGECETSVRVTMINLPWVTQLVEEPAGKIRNTIRSAIAGRSPGYVTECSVQGIFTVEDECVGPISTAMENLPNGNVLSEFDKKSEEEKENSTCKIGGAKSDIIKGKEEVQQKKEVATYVNLRAGKEKEKEKKEETKTPPRWEQCKKVVTAKTGNWKDALCSKGEKEGEWLTMEVTETEEVTSHTIGKVELTDTKALGGAETVRCEWVDRGWIGANGGGGESEVVPTRCERITGPCENDVRVTMINLPWITQLVEEPFGKIRNTTRSEIVGKSPGYFIECRVGGKIKIEDECVSPISTAMENLPNGNVLATFDKKSEEEKENSTCIVGGPKSDIIKGQEEVQQKKEVATYVNIR